MKRRALISVTDKTGVADFARELVQLGFSILSTGGTARALRDAGVTVEDVAAYTGFPEIFGGRVKTLHPAVHGGILAPRGDRDAAAVMAEHGIDPIDVVAVNLYRFEEAAARDGAGDDEVIEAIDIGGPCMIRAAAKNHAHVAVVTRPDDYGALLAALRVGDDAALAALRRRLAARAFAHTARYDTAVASWFANADTGDATEPPPTLAVFADRKQTLRYGENPHQQAAFYAAAGSPAPNLATARQLGGKELSYNNLVDLDAALALVVEFEQPACAIIKHTNPCGTAIADSPSRAFESALAADPLSAFGGIVALNRRLDAALARAILARDTFVEAIIAPHIDEDAAAALATGRGGKSLRLLSLDGEPAAPAGLTLREVRGGILAQTPDAAGSAGNELRAVTRRAPSDDESAALAFAWRVAKHVKSNAIVLAHSAGDGAFATVGVGAGQMSRVDSVEIAVRKAGDRAAGAVMASDAFFPFADGVEKAAAAGVRAAVQPGGSRNDDQVIAAADAAGMAMVFTGARHFRH